MSLLESLMAEEKIIPAVKIATEEISAAPVTPTESLACPACNSLRFWRSIYSPELHCLACVPPPSPSLVAERLDYGETGQDDYTPPGSDPGAHQSDSGQHLRPDILFTTHRPGCFWPDFSKASASSLRPSQGHLKRETPCCPHCGAEMTRANIVKQELKPKRGGWARGSCKACGKEVWPLIAWLPGERSEENSEENSGANPAV